MSKAVTICTALVLALGACNPGGDDGETQEPEVTYWDDIEPLVAKNCRGCHKAGGVAPMGLESFEEVQEWGRVMETRIVERSMPPWGVVDDGSCNDFQDSLWLSNEDIELFQQWVADGMAEGTPGIASLPAEQNPKLDGDFSLATPAYSPTAWGTPIALYDDYVCFELNLDQAADKFVTGFELTPGDVELAHHAVFFLVDREAPSAIEGATNGDVMTQLDNYTEAPGWPCFGAAGDGVVFKSIPGGWAPGSGGVKLPDNTGFRITAGDSLIVQMHYNMSAPGTTGRTGITEEIDFALADSVEREAFIALPDEFLSTLANETPASLPPGQSSVEYSWSQSAVEVVASFTGGTAILGQNVDEVEVFGVLPHMHELGRTQKATVTYGDGTEACLSDVHNWDFNWQRVYFYDSGPVKLDASSVVNLNCEYDTTSRTDPTYAGWGTQNEMCLVGMYFSLPADR